MAVFFIAVYRSFVFMIFLAGDFWEEFSIYQKISIVTNLQRNYTLNLKRGVTL